MRLESCDIYITLVRRKYIPPLLETFQDLTVVSVYNHPDKYTSKLDELSY